MEESKDIKLSYEKREKADYYDFYIASREEAEKQVERAEKFTNSIRVYLISQNVL